MKLSHNFFCLLLVVLVCLLAVFIDPTEARRKAGKKAKNGVCKYARKGEDGPCDTATNMKEVSLPLRRGDPATCAATKAVSKPCDDMSLSKKKKVKGCKYERKGSDWSECDDATGMKTKVMTLKEGSNPECPPERTKTKSCKNRKGSKGGRKSRKGCVYNKQPWSECNLETMTRQREMILARGDPRQCLPKKIVTKRCKKACRYKKGDWSECDPTTNLKQRILTPKRNAASQCEPTFQSKPCHGANLQQLTAAKSNKCRYNLSEWSACNRRTNTMTQWMTLKSGDPNVCLRSKKLSKKCKIACKFRRGEWSACDDRTQLTTRVDTLVKGSPEDCEMTREITRKCKKVCKYEYGDWSECDPVTNHRSRVKKLVEGGDTAKCQAEDTVTKACTRKDGGERCFFGAWGDFGPCTNGVMTKHRPVLQGGVTCERKAVITKACEKNS